MLAAKIDAFQVRYGANTYANTAFDWIQRHVKSLTSQVARAALVVMRQLSRTGAPAQMEADWADTAAARKTAASNFILRVVRLTREEQTLDVGARSKSFVTRLSDQEDVILCH